MVIQPSRWEGPAFTTVAASMSAPTLYVLARDLAEMRVNASIDESDIGGIQPGQPVSFRVDAYPDEVFTGAVSQVRLEPEIQQNVVSYVTIIDVPNPDLKQLRPASCRPRSTTGWRSWTSSWRRWRREQRVPSYVPRPASQAVQRGAS